MDENDEHWKDEHSLPKFEPMDDPEPPEPPDLGPPGSYLAEITSPDEPEDLIDDLPLPGEAVQLLTALKRRQVLGKLAEFELLLSSLTLKQQNFTLAYLNDPTNASAAAQKAGYAQDTARMAANRLLNHGKVRAAIAAGQLLREDRTMVTSEMTINELAIIAFSDITNYEIDPETHRVRTLDGIPNYMTRAISQIEFTVTTRETDRGDITTEKTKIKLWSKPDALRMLALYQKLLSPDGGVVVNDNSVHNHQHNTWQFGDRKVQF